MSPISRSFVLVVILVFVSTISALSQYSLDVIKTKAGVVYKGRIIERKPGEGYMIKTVGQEFIFVREQDVESITQEDSNLDVQHGVQQPLEVRARKTIDSVGAPKFMYSFGAVGTAGIDRMIYIPPTNAVGAVGADLNYFLGFSATAGILVGKQFYLDIYGRTSWGAGTATGEFDGGYATFIADGTNVDANFHALGFGTSIMTTKNMIHTYVYHCWQNEIASESFAGIPKGATRSLTGWGLHTSVSFPLTSGIGLYTGGDIILIKDGLSLRYTAGVEFNNVIALLNQL